MGIIRNLCSTGALNPLGTRVVEIVFTLNTRSIVNTVSKRRPREYIPRDVQIRRELGRWNRTGENEACLISSRWNRWEDNTVLGEISKEIAICKRDGELIEI